ncbi:GntR family transcriptional regulator [Geminicoccus roseus]|uniref:GntR family transcriptional regulator n=1 Tax=Geminicoccus roseus TaxID=404900 RepID=UPI00040952A6|nr:GntR family transcriptional regulator [Geminicoccus roseus]
MATNLTIGRRETAAGIGASWLDLPVDRRRNVADQIYQGLRDAVLELRLPPRTLISENMICRQTGVSRTPVRNAIVRLVEEGLLDVFPQQGTYVAPIKLAEVKDGHFIRKALEIAILEKAATMWTPEASQEAHAVLAEHEALCDLSDVQAFFRVDEKFHQCFARAAGVEGVWRPIQHAKAHLDRLHRLGFPVNDRMKAVALEHRAILDAFEAGDLALARSRLNAHLDVIIGMLGELSQRYRDYFDE